MPFSTLQRALTDEAFHQSLKAHALQQSKRFSWDKSAKRALRAIEEMAIPGSPKPGNKDVSILLDKIAALKPGVSPCQKDLIAVSQCIVVNREVAYKLDPASNRDTTSWKDKIICSGFDSSGSMLAGTHRDENGDPLPLSYPDIEAIRCDVWLPDDRPRVLLLKLDHIGDFIITLDAFRLIRDTWPKAHITLVCGPWNKILAERSGLFDAIFCCEFFAEAGADYDVTDMMERGLAKYRELALGTYDLAVDLRYYTDSRMLLLHTNAKYRAG
jgi:hypothetical protein